MNNHERGHPPSRPPAGPPPAKGGPRRVEALDTGAGPHRVADPAAGRGPRRATAPAVEPAAGRGPRRLAKPKPVRVKATDTGRPQRIGNREVDAVRESWLVEDRWWTDEPLRRRYWEVVTADGRDLVVFRDLEQGRWFTQR
ncbi:MAG TPA: hypothetical protein VFZ00_28865 [Solirubrobacter sp.]|nr:hypothetical protein [Solirubrobacter sp.]